MQKSISDEKEVKRAERKEKDLRKQELNDIRTVLSNASGRRFLWRILSKCNTFNSVYTKDENRVFYNSGQQDIGHFLMAEVVETDENLLLKMMKDNQTKNNGEIND